MPVFPATLQILLADDDSDDCLLFREALAELPGAANLTIKSNGELLLRHLQNNQSELPQVLFLDLNLPRRNGLQCLQEIKKNPCFSILAVIIFSTTADEEMVDLLYEQDADYYIRKPLLFIKWIEVITRALQLVKSGLTPAGSREKFMLTPKLSGHVSY